MKQTFTQWTAINGWHKESDSFWRKNLLRKSEIELLRQYRTEMDLRRVSTEQPVLNELP